MYDLVHRAAPESARARSLLTLVFGVVAVCCTALVFTMHGLAVPLSVVIGGLAAVLALVIGHGLTAQAEAAPDEENPAFLPERVDASSDADPIGTLQQRYAEGELTDEEFEARMDRLIESGAGPSRSTDESEKERAFER